MAGDLAFVTSQNADMVTIVDLGSGQIISSTPVSGAPAPVAYDAQRSLAYVISAKDGVLHVLNETGRDVWRIKLGEGAFGIAIAQDGGLFITDWYGHRLSRYDGRLSRIWSVRTGASPAGVALTSDGALVATADRDDDQISLYDASNGRRLRAIKVGKHPYAIVAYDGRLWTTDVQSDTVTVVDPILGRVEATIPTGSHPYGLAFAGGKGFVTNQYAGTISVFDAKTLAPLATLETGDYPEGIATLPDGSGVAIVHWESNTMVIVDAATLAVRKSIELPDGPRAFGLFTGRQQ
ncbi:hypothetical protein JCM7686_0094 [Paracoccus aminophilus JCM 7686]|uniref:Pyrrolo-quinoline quinone repeat domain-containing protein n=1 Tax=Paracoccus aminophilus JCM 7686 TaxID=1367847 RepID=S5XV44_PARAH|nr:hypothetical protein JCM7686_0094 [Paracoccus aminophilus JCM 7686]